MRIPLIGKAGAPDKLYAVLSKDEDWLGAGAQIDSPDPAVCDNGDILLTYQLVKADKVMISRDVQTTPLSLPQDQPE